MFLPPGVMARVCVNILQVAEESGLVQKTAVSSSLPAPPLLSLFVELIITNERNSQKCQVLIWRHLLMSTLLVDSSSVVPNQIERPALLQASCLALRVTLLAQFFTEGCFQSVLCTLSALVHFLSKVLGMHQLEVLGGAFLQPG